MAKNNKAHASLPRPFSAITPCDPGRYYHTQLCTRRIEALHKEHYSSEALRTTPSVLTQTLFRFLAQFPPHNSAIFFNASRARYCIITLYKVLRGRLTQTLNNLPTTAQIFKSIDILGALLCRALILPSWQMCPDEMISADREREIMINEKAHGDTIKFSSTADSTDLRLDLVVTSQEGMVKYPNLTSDDFRRRLAERVHVLSMHKQKTEVSMQMTTSAPGDQQGEHILKYSEAETLPICGIRGGYMSPHNSDSEQLNLDNEEEESDEDSSTSEEEYEGDDLDEATLTPQKPPTTSANNPLLTGEPLVFQQRSKYFQRHQQIREAETQKGGNHIAEIEDTSIPSGGLFGGGTLFASEKAATSTDSLGSTKRKRDEEVLSHEDKGKQKEEDKEAPLHDDIDDYERELRELENRNRKRAMTAKGE